MTFREKLTMEHPDHIDDDLAGGCVGCPHTHGYEPYEDRPCIHTIYSCTKCWDREMPGSSDPNGDKGEEGDCGMKNICKHVKPTPDLNALIERAGTKKDISLLIHINGDDTTISVYPCPDPSEKKGNPVAEAYKLLVGSSYKTGAIEAAIDYLGEALEC